MESASEKASEWHTRVSAVPATEAFGFSDDLVE
jgi:hypothetical protein